MAEDSDPSVDVDMIGSGTDMVVDAGVDRESHILQCLCCQNGHNTCYQ
ncbi:hypothetical protein KIPB_017220, partial [Kipferlia bialata]|eukprot:g17220.t1